MPPPRDSSLKRRLSLKAEGLSNPSVGAGMYARRNDAKQAGVGAVNHSASEPSFFADPFSNGVVNHLADASANGDPQATSGLHGTDSVGHPLQAGAPPDASGPFGLHPNEISRQIHSSASYSEASGYEHHPLPGSAHSYVGSPPTSNGHHMASFSGPSGGYAPPQYGAPHMPAHILHRASISGPIMQHGSYGGPTAAAVTTAGLASGAHAGGSITAPPMAGDTAAWAHAHGAPRPHTADGMFGSFGFGANGYAPASTEGSAAAESEVSYARGDHSQHLVSAQPLSTGLVMCRLTVCARLYPYMRSSSTTLLKLVHVRTMG
ncbi:hypothetical protein K437DRAFT_43008 [Tilletiaria anomala UBC 951]|uniref:Uncharacterized protein n=1 Tax=Tilletiaria anomala (strain ATCC 24038 / CBS 436.72 / UBC 951) TaxID=1037660 RepID=A0A066V640_TILAU|nr:uncharacterized protein K437DRAFT_43008 [Tilletiaria anomala UBC 951]KDN37217.1 hypothetical protein K437DRAFT_43008 [Tilletiaria anomala UBC 951]